MGAGRRINEPYGPGNTPWEAARGRRPGQDKNRNLLVPSILNHERCYARDINTPMARESGVDKGS